MDKLPAKGEAMPQTIEAWQRLYGLAEQAMKLDKAEIERLQLKNSQLIQKVDQLRSRLCPMCEGYGQIGAMTAEGGDAVDCPECEAQLQSDDLTITPELNAFLHGAGNIRGLSFGEPENLTGRPRMYWWRKLLPPLPSPPKEQG